MAMIYTATKPFNKFVYHLITNRYQGNVGLIFDEKSLTLKIWFKMFKTLYSKTIIEYS